MNIDYVVLTKGENETLNLLRYLYKNKDNKDCIYTLYDNTEDNPKGSLYQRYSTVVYHKLSYSYSEHRNSILPLLQNEYSFWLDSDEKPAKELMRDLKSIIKKENYPDLIHIPRINVVKGLQKEDALQYGWHVTDGNIIQWNTGDYQTRIMKNNVGLSFRGNLHERIIPLANHSVYILPKEPRYALTHSKTREQQMNNNKRYNEKYTEQENKGIHGI